MQIELMEKQLKALGDQNRLKLLSCLKKGEVCVCEFVEVLNISQPAVSQHLRKLKDAGIIAERKVGTWKHYRLTENQSPIVQCVIDELKAVSICTCKVTEDSSCSS
ncbi:ArsR/SmtB family transcription factor [Lysinibacillus sp. 54212]|uniref:ArsR/SmtB family transcription factor n=1 Tax=Lysinibacillus sp. 54212 TaxID=3119829 RepID=UPI002FC72351